jgi:hypothetical protein
MLGGSNRQGRSAADLAESSIAEEILETTSAITDMAEPGTTYLPGQIKLQLSRRNVNRSVLYTESEIFGRMSQALKAAAFDPTSVSSIDRVVISMG